MGNVMKKVGNHWSRSSSNMDDLEAFHKVTELIYEIRH